MTLLRFPYLVLENGGGAFLILFFLALNLVAFPLLITEKILDDKLQKIDLASLLSVKKKHQMILFDKAFLSLWFLLRVLIHFSFLIFFLYLGASGVDYAWFFAKTLMSKPMNIVDVPHWLESSVHPWTPFAWCALVLWGYFNIAALIHVFVKRILPFCLAALMVVFLKIIFLSNDLEGLKNLFYPDFLSLGPSSLLSALGQCFACLFIGFGLFGHMFKFWGAADPIETFVRGTIVAVCLAMIVGVMALPMLEQVSESTFGAKWIFEIIPRWLSYGEFGQYYCFLFFVALSGICFFIAVALTLTTFENLKLVPFLRKKKLSLTMLSLLYIPFFSGWVLFLQNHLNGWIGQSFLLDVDRVLVHFILPLFVLMMLWVVFRYTRRRERMEVFKEQQVFFHNQYFFRCWEAVTLYGVPVLILAAWALDLSRFIGS